MKILENLNLEDTKSVLSHLRIYSDMTKKLWKRGRELFERTLHSTKVYKIEYFPSLWEDAAWSGAQRVFEKSFGEKPERLNVRFTPNEAVKWGMKIYVNDNMVDMSFDKVEKLMQK